MLRIAALLAFLGGTLVAGPVQAQSGAIFGDSPPRPPADVPSGPFPPQPPPVQYPGQFPSQSSLPAPPATRQPSAIEVQPLPPPPGASAGRVEGPNQGASPQLPPPVQRPRAIPQPANVAPQPSNQAAQQPADTAPPPDDIVVTELPAQKIANGRAVFSGLDKITGRIISFDAAIGETVQFGALQVTARVCYTRPPTEPTNTDAFVEVDEVTLQGEIKRIFSGWMFASSPGLHAVEHPIYDVWLTDCAAPLTVAEPAVAPTPAPVTAPSPTRPRQAASQRRQPAPAAAASPAGVSPAVPAQPR
jgi:hypothetical protein